MAGENVGNSDALENKGEVEELKQGVGLDVNELSETERSRLKEEKAQADRQLGAQVLASVGFQDRHAKITESSLSKEKARGGKLLGKNTQRRNLAYLGRLERLIDKYGNPMEKRLWNSSIEKLVIDPGEIEENYWKSQELILRDNGQGRKLDDFEKEVLVQDIQARQRESLKTWADYLGDEETPYPMWFKVFAWDGMSKMGVFDKGRGEFKKRDEHTVAPYPKLNPAALAKVYGAFDDFYRYKNNKDRTEGKSNAEERDEKLDALVRSGSFNKLYSKFLLGQKAILKTPERTEDIRGEWIEYLPGEEQKLAEAAEGTPWCVADPGTGRRYLRGYEDENWNEDEDERYETGEELDSQAKFILFHLEDPDSGQLSDSACASIRLDTDGQVAEISGLGEGQVLEDALVPIVEEKVKTLPGGDRFLRAFADKKRMIELDRRVQRGGELGDEDAKFIFGKIEGLDRYMTDPRIVKIQRRAYENLGLDGVIRNGAGAVNVAKELMNPEEVEQGFDELVKLEVPVEVLIGRMTGEQVLGRLDQLQEMGMGLEQVFSGIPNKYRDGVVEDFLERGADPDRLAWMLSKEMVAKHIATLAKYGVSDEVLGKRLIIGEDPYKQGIELVLENGGDVNEFVSRLGKWRALEAEDGRFGSMSSIYGYLRENFEELVKKGVDPNVLVEMMGAARVHVIQEMTEKMIDWGVDPDVLWESLSYEQRLEYFDRLVDHGLDPKKIEYYDKKEMAKHFRKIDEVQGESELVEDVAREILLRPWEGRTKFVDDNLDILLKFMQPSFTLKYLETEEQLLKHKDELLGAGLKEETFNRAIARRR